ncbi:MAG: hypothetical protein M3071_21730 [Actinomycetota bacterium]|nr:hypothetical protein [Actinomycetota bacterium]
MTSPSRDGDKLPRPRGAGGHWTSFVADPEPKPDSRVVRHLHEEANPHHRLRVEHDAHTLLIHLSGEDGYGWTTIAVDRATRRSAVGQAARQSDAALGAYEGLYRP